MMTKWDGVMLKSRKNHTAIRHRPACEGKHANLEDLGLTIQKFCQFINGIVLQQPCRLQRYGQPHEVFDRHGPSNPNHPICV